MKNPWIIGGIIIIVGSGYIWYKNQSTEAPIMGSFKIGSILPLTGDFAVLGQEIRRGAEIAVEEARAKGQDIEYISEDDQFSPLVMATAAQKLIQVDKVDVAITAIIQEAKPIAPIFNKAQTPLLVTWDSNDFIKSAGDYIFSIGFSTEAAGKRMAEYAYAKASVRKIAIISHIDEWSQLIADSFAAEFIKQGGTVVMREAAQVNNKDYRTLLTKAKNAGADSIYFPLVPPANSIVLKQVKQLGITAILFSGDGLLQDEINEAGVASEGVYYTNIYADHPETLADVYKKKYGSDPAEVVFVSFGYDGVRTLLTARSLAEKKGVSLRDALTMVQLEGVGAPIAMNGTRYSERLEKVYKVVNKKPVLVQ